MKQFDYKTVVRIATQPYLSLEQLNELGKEGWELCTARLRGEGSDYIFKRVVVSDTTGFSEPFPYTLIDGRYYYVDETDDYKLKPAPRCN